MVLCRGAQACSFFAQDSKANEASIGSTSCQDAYACRNFGREIDTKTSVADPSIMVGNGSCNGDSFCQSFGYESKANSVKVGNGSCNSGCTNCARDDYDFSGLNLVVDDNYSICPMCNFVGQVVCPSADDPASCDTPCQTQGDQQSSCTDLAGNDYECSCTGENDVLAGDPYWFPFPSESNPDQCNKVVSKCDSLPCQPDLLATCVEDSGKTAGYYCECSNGYTATDDGAKCAVDQSITLEITADSGIDPILKNFCDGQSSGEECCHGDDACVGWLKGATVTVHRGVCRGKRACAVSRVFLHWTWCCLL